MFDKLLSGVGLGWLGRRVPDWGGWLLTFGGTLFAMHDLLPASMQQELWDTFRQAFTDWREIRLGQLAGMAGVISLLWSQRNSFRATVKDQVVVDGEKLTDKDMTRVEKNKVKNVVADKVDEKKSKRPASPIGGGGLLGSIIKGMLGK